MTKFILGKKIGMSRIFDENNKSIPVTIIEAGPCFITQVKSQEKDKYSAVQIGFEEKKEKKIKKTDKNKPYKYLSEFKAEKANEYKIGDKIEATVFQKGEKVIISGTSKGKGFQGVVKRHGFSGGPASHGHRHVLRTPGSIGSAFPQKVMKGKRMAGHAGVQRFTVKNLKIVDIDERQGLLVIKGAVPGPNNGLIQVISL